MRVREVDHSCIVFVELRLLFDWFSSRTERANYFLMLHLYSLYAYRIIDSMPWIVFLSEFSRRCLTH